MNKEQIGIYKISCIANGTIYIGSSYKINCRFAQHKCDLKKNKHGNSRIQRTYNKYGENSFTYEIIFNVLKQEDLLSIEQLIFDYYTDLGYEMLNCGTRIDRPMYERVYTEEDRLKFSELTKGEKNPRWGVSLSQETKDKIAEAHTGKKRGPCSETRKQNISKAKKGKPILALKGRKRSKEAIKSIKLGRKDNKQLIDSNGNLFLSMNDAAKFHNIERMTISNYFRGVTKTNKMPVTFGFIDKELYLLLIKN